MSRAQENDAEIQRLRWQCRRGMLELDVALRRLLDEGFADLDASGKAAFYRLLQTQDQVLYEWLMGKSAPDDPEIRALVAKMRAAGQESGDAAR